MEITLLVKCSCGHIESIIIEELYNYLSITDSIEKNSVAFKANQNSPDETKITCTACGKRVGLAI